VVHHGPQHAFFKGLGSPVKEKHVLPGFYHDTLGEKDRALAVGKARRFILRQFDNPPEPPTCATPTASARPATSPTPSPARCRGSARGRCTGRPTGPT
jgi:hypothetical protein